MTNDSDSEMTFDRSPGYILLKYQSQANIACIRLTYSIVLHFHRKMGFHFHQKNLLVQQVEWDNLARGHIFSYPLKGRTQEKNWPSQFDLPWPQ